MEEQNAQREEFQTHLPNMTLSGLDPQYLYGAAYNADLKARLRSLTKEVDVLEINHYQNSEASIKLRSLDKDQLSTWIDKVSHASGMNEGQGFNGGLRLILGRSSLRMPTELPATFPTDIKAVEDSHRTIPFSTSMLRKIIEKFHLPVITPWVFITDQSHFARHSASSGDYIGYTMRRPTWGILAMDICLSISYCTKTGMTLGVLHGCSELQQSFIVEQLRTFASLARHPLLLPILFSAHQRQLVHQEARKLYYSLLNIEMASGQTGAPVKGTYYPSIGAEDFSQMSNLTLGILQLASAWQNTLKGIMLGIKEIQENIEHLSRNTKNSVCPMEESEGIFSGWLHFTLHQSEVVLSQLEYIDKRAQAQMAAVRFLRMIL